jgi:uncharacterized protein (DUF1786 family)
MNRSTSDILAIDIGAGTQDILLYEEKRSVENSVKLVLPSWTTILSQSIDKATRGGRPVFLTGNLMGGGPCVSAMRRHIRAGHRVYATPLSAKTVRDNLDQVREMGIEVVQHRPKQEGLLILRTCDVDLAMLRSMLAPLGVALPSTVAIAVQDHGEALTTSQRRFRFQHWREFVEVGGCLLDLIYDEVPPYLTRMKAIQRDAPGALMMDTGSAAVWGALQDASVADHQHEGLVVVNVGNQHTIGVLLQNKRIWGLFEHHTRLLTEEKLADHVDRLRRGTLPNEEVFADNGHGAIVHPDYERFGNRAQGGFEFVAVTGPRRAIVEAQDYYMAVPHGDMMLSGCFGLVAATKALLETRS